MINKTLTLLLSKNILQNRHKIIKNLKYNTSVLLISLKPLIKMRSL